MFSIALLMSLILGPGFAVASQTAMAVIVTYPYTNTLYDNAYNSIDDKYSSSYGNSEYDYAYYNKNNNNNTNNDKYSSNYGNSEYDYAYNNDTNNDKYSDSYSKPSNTYNNNNKNNNDRNDSSDDKYSDTYNNSDGYSKYPTNDKLYECQKGPLEGFFTSSVEFCIAANSNTT